MYWGSKLMKDCFGFCRGVGEVSWWSASFRSAYGRGRDDGGLGLSGLYVKIVWFGWVAACM